MHSRDRELELCRLAKRGDRAAEAEMVEENIDLVKAILSRRYYCTSATMREEMEAAGMEGLLTAVRRFDPERGFRFSTYAVRCITTAITECVHRSNGADIRGRDVPILRARDEIERRLSSGESVESIANSMPKPKSLKYKYSGRHIMKILRQTAPHVSLDREHALQLADETENAEEKLGWKQRGNAVFREIHSLKGKSRAIMTMSAEGYSLGEIADKLGCTRWWVRTLFDRTANQIRERIEGRRKAA